MKMKTQAIQRVINLNNYIICKYLINSTLHIGESRKRSMGLFFDKYLNMNDQVSSVCWPGYYRLNIRSIKPVLYQEALCDVTLTLHHVGFLNTALTAFSDFKTVLHTQIQVIQNMSLLHQFSKNYIGSQ